MAMEPIELEFLLKDNLTPGLQKASTASEALGESAEAMAAKVKEQVKAQEEQIKKLEAQIKKLEQELKKIDPGKAHIELTAQVEACSQAIHEERQALASLGEQHDKTTQSVKSLKTEQRQLQLELARMRLSGEQNSQAYRDLSLRAAELTDTLGDVRAEVNALAHDNAGLQGVISGMSGLSGAMTATTGIMGIFISEQEELAAMQTRLQSVMAITMGMQQLMDTLNQDSAFSTDTLRKAKEMFAGTMSKLTTVMWGSKAAATALMGALSLGLGVAITAAISAYNSYTKAQEEAKKRAEELVEVERQGRAEMVRKQFELTNVMRSIKNFNGTKDEERRKVKELNNTYGDTFGHYKSLAEWYDVLEGKSKAYVRQLFLQAKAQSLIDKAVKADEEINKIKAQGEGEHGRWYDSFVYAISAGGEPKATSAMGDLRPSKVRQERYKEALMAAEKAKQDIDKELEAIVAEAQSIGKEYNLGGHNAEREDQQEQERQVENDKKNAQERTKAIQEGYKALAEAHEEGKRYIQDLQQEAREESSDKEREALRIAYERDMAEVKSKEEKRLALIAELRRKGAALGAGAEEKTSALARGQEIALTQAYQAGIERINKKEVEEKQATLGEILGKYRDFDAQRRAIELEYQADIKQLEALRPSGDEAQINAAQAMAKRERDKQLKEIDQNELNQTKQTSAFLVGIFEEAGNKSVGEIKRIIAEAEALMNYLKTTESQDITSQHGISADNLKAIKDNPKEIEALTGAIKTLKGEVSGRNPFEAFFAELQQGIALVKKGDKSSLGQGISAIGAAVQKVMPHVQALGNTLGAAFGQEIGESIGIITGLVGDLGSAATGVGQLLSGDILGGITGIASSIGSLLGKFSKAREVHAQALKAIEDAQLDFERRYTLLLLRQRLMLEDASSAFGDERVRKAANALKVYADAQEEVRKRTQRLKDVEVVSGHKRTGLFGLGKGKDTYSGILALYPQLVKASGELDAALLKEVMASRSIKAEHKKILEALLESHEMMQEAMQQMDDYLSDVFGSLGKSATNALVASIREGRDALEVFADDAAKVLEQLGEQIAYSLFFSDKFKRLGEDLKRIHSIGNEANIARETTKLLGNFYKGLKGDMRDAQEFTKRFKEEAKQEGFDLWQDGGAQQSARAGAFTTMTQEQGTKLEGLFTSGQVHWASIDDQLIGITQAMSTALSTLATIASNTKPIADIYNEIQMIKRDGIKIK